MISKLCNLLTSKNENIYSSAAVTLSCIFVYDQSPQFIDKAILEGVFPKFLQILYSGGSTEIYHKILFGLSNITGGFQSHIDAFFQEEELV